jgi:type IV secretory pathway VirB10-like protein
MCPEPALLVAYLDRTLFYRDATAIDRHLETCSECSALLAAMRERRAAEQASKASRTRMMIVAAVVLVSLMGYGLWTVRPQSAGEPVRDTEPPRSDSAPPPPSTRTTTADSRPPSPPSKSEAKTTQPPAAKPVPQVREETRRPRPSAVAPPPHVMWRTRDQIVESSNDGGATWTTEHTADRPIRASVFVNDEVAWVVGDNGLVLRRTKNGWFGASAPADGNVTAVKASSPSRATVTLEDGRVFTTANGGVTWSSAP